LDAAGPLDASSLLSTDRHQSLQQVQQLKTLYSMAQTLPADVLQHNAVAIDPSTRRTLLSERFFLYRGWQAFQRGDVETAEVLLPRAGERMSCFVDQRSVILFHFQAHWKRGLERSIAQDQPSYLCCGNLAVVAFQLKRYHEAIEGFNSTLAILRKSDAPWLLQDEATTLFNRAIAWLRLGEDRRGVEDLRMSLTADPSNAAVQAALALALRRTEKYVEAESVYSQLAQLRQSQESKQPSRPSSPSCEFNR
jgi:tetratricopeptide (TPR) repeat protein